MKEILYSCNNSTNCSPCRSMYILIIHSLIIHAYTGWILAAFFYGYILTQIPGGWLAERVGGKWVFGVGVFMTSVFTLLTPLAAFFNFKLLIIIRALEGFFEVRVCVCTRWKFLIRTLWNEGIYLDKQDILVVQNTLFMYIATPKIHVYIECYISLYICASSCVYMYLKVVIFSD